MFQDVRQKSLLAQLFFFSIVLNLEFHKLSNDWRDLF
jgi:hypothetical protein